MDMDYSTTRIQDFAQGLIVPSAVNTWAIILLNQTLTS